MNSFWEKRIYLTDLQDVVVGAGIVGLFTAIYLKRSDITRRVVVLDKHPFSSGASTKNAGFACFGSPSEILDDLVNMNRIEVANLIHLRWKGLENLRSELGDAAIGYKSEGGFELFREEDSNLMKECMENLEKLNQLMVECIGKSAYTLSSNFLNFNSKMKFIGAIENTLEGSIDTGKTMWSLREKCRKMGIEVLTGDAVASVDMLANRPEFNWCNELVRCERLFVCTNGFTSELLPNVSVTPARNQVMVTSPLSKPIPDGTFHVDKGYIYFRGIDNRLLIGGFRNTDHSAEITSQFGITDNIQNSIRKFISDYVTDENYTTDFAWSGILGVGEVKSPIVERVGPNSFIGVRMGGMGVAIGSIIGRNLADLARES